MRESWTWHGITHLLLSQQDEIEGEGTEGRNAWNHLLAIKPSGPDSEWE